MSGYIVEHRESRFARRLRRRRLQVALAVAAVEAMLVLVGAIPWWLVVALAVAAVAGYVWVGRDHRNPTIRAASWVAAVSQLIVVLVPVAVVVVGLLAIVLVVVLAVGALAALLLDRR
jgi:hypothetical protein